MSQENVELVRGLFENTNARDFQSVMDAYADDVVLELHGGPRFPRGEGAVGKEAVGEWFGDWFRTFDRDYYFAIERLEDLGDDRVLLLATHHAHGRSSGTPVAHQSGWIYEIYDGKITRCDAYYFSEEALAAAGMSE